MKMKICPEVRGSGGLEHVVDNFEGGGDEEDGAGGRLDSTPCASNLGHQASPNANSMA